ncbi:MAG: hypothetical protein CVV41_03415 [Candidatus Riflebacteria bacterium HGW-Riflebacteria-1]|jgi:CTP:molybdopterin cytidylyltransferase MocA|nr:MAG: hypothetical protein CVV41_03415 [Candidatus Riflebacteria bacterium HGW-Riflebacteria-1]
MPDALILLAGFSTRMGQLKQHTRLGGRTFLETVIAKLSASRERLQQLVFVGQSSDSESRKLVEDCGGIWLTNPQPELGPLSSIRIAIENSSNANAKLLWPIDHPMIATATINRLIELWQTSPELITVPSNGTQRGHPTIFPHWCYHEFFNIELSAGAKKILQLFPDRINYLLTDDIWITRNLNTPQMLSEAEEWLQVNRARSSAE